MHGISATDTPCHCLLDNYAIIEEGILPTDLQLPSEVRL